MTQEIAEMCVYQHHNGWGGGMLCTGADPHGLDCRKVPPGGREPAFSHVYDHDTSSWRPTLLFFCSFCFQGTSLLACCVIRRSYRLCLLVYIYKCIVRVPDMALVHTHLDLCCWARARWRRRFFPFYFKRSIKPRACMCVGGCGCFFGWKDSRPVSPSLGEPRWASWWPSNVHHQLHTR